MPRSCVTTVPGGACVVMASRVLRRDLSERNFSTPTMSKTQQADCHGNTCRTKAAPSTAHPCTRAVMAFMPVHLSPHQKCLGDIKSQANALRQGTPRGAIEFE